MLMLAAIARIGAIAEYQISSLIKLNELVRVLLNPTSKVWLLNVPSWGPTTSLA